MLYISYSRDTGLRLFDIKYRGERIIYELGLEEAIAHYAGNDPVQSGTAYLDTVRIFFLASLVYLTTALVLRIWSLRVPAVGGLRLPHVCDVPQHELPRGRS